MKTAEQRFLSRVLFGDDCWAWLGGKTDGGYGTLWSGTRHVRAHRYAYELLVGPIPEGLEVDHLCHNVDESCPGGFGCPHRACVRPDHLEPVSHRENGLRGKSFAAVNARKTHCPQGHPYNEENTYPRTEGIHRMCRPCHLARSGGADTAEGGDIMLTFPETTRDIPWPSGAEQQGER